MMQVEGGHHRGAYSDTRGAGRQKKNIRRHSTIWPATQPTNQNFFFNIFFSPPTNQKTFFLHEFLI